MDKEETVSGHLIFIVDTSATMLTKKDGVSLFSENQDAMKELAASWDGQPVTIVTTGKEPVTVIREETNGAVVTAAIDKLAVSYEHEYMGRAIEFTQSITAGSGADIHIYTDSFDRSAIPEGDGKLSWTVNGSKDPAVNVSIDKFGAVQSSRWNRKRLLKLLISPEDDMTGDVRTNRCTNRSHSSWKKHSEIEGRKRPALVI